MNQPTLASIRAAIMAWVLPASGLANGQIYWADQDAPAPTGNYVALRLPAFLDIGSMHDQNQYIDHSNDMPPPAAGQEIEDINGGTAEMTLSIQAFVTPVVGTISSEGAYTLMNAIKGALFLPDVRDALNDAGLSPFDFGQVQNLAQVAGGQFEGRAALDVRFYVPETASERVGYITDVNVQQTDNGSLVDPAVRTFDWKQPTN
jgi:hypothetical protein